MGGYGGGGERFVSFHCTPPKRGNGHKLQCVKFWLDIREKVIHCDNRHCKKLAREAVESTSLERFRNSLDGTGYESNLIYSSPSVNRRLDWKNVQMPLPNLTVELYWHWDHVCVGETFVAVISLPSLVP